MHKRGEKSLSISDWISWVSRRLLLHAKHTIMMIIGNTSNIDANTAPLFPSRLSASCSKLIFTNHHNDLDSIIIIKMSQLHTAAPKLENQAS